MFGKVQSRLLIFSERDGVILNVDPETCKIKREFPVNALRQLETSVTDPCMLRLGFNPQIHNNTYTLVFSSPEERKRFIQAVPQFFRARPLNEQPTLAETVVSTEKIQFWTGTWNMGSAAASPQALEHWIPLGSRYAFYVVGLQECFDGSGKDDPQNFEQLVAKHIGDKYVLVTHVALWSIRLMLFVHQTHVAALDSVETGVARTGFARVAGNKGGAAVYFWLYHTSFCFVVCHLAARAERMKQRERNICDITHGIRLGFKDVDLTSQSEHCVWMGDLNYRVELGFQTTAELVRKNDWPSLIQYDQLTREIAAGRVFQGFQEGTLQFPPTYRWKRGIEGNQLSNKRGQAPSYTDRILFKTPQRGGNPLKQTAYTAHHDVSSSDHKPVSGEFEVNVRTGIRESTNALSAPLCLLVINRLTCQMLKATEEISVGEDDDSSSDDDGASPSPGTITPPSLQGSVDGGAAAAAGPPTPSKLTPHPTGSRRGGTFRDPEGKVRSRRNSIESAPFIFDDRGFSFKPGSEGLIDNSQQLLSVTVFSPSLRHSSDQFAHTKPSAELEPLAQSLSPMMNNGKLHLLIDLHAFPAWIQSDYLYVAVKTFSPSDSALTTDGIAKVSLHQSCSEQPQRFSEPLFSGGRVVGLLEGDLHCLFYSVYHHLSSRTSSRSGDDPPPSSS
eukprot:TRINITY_DN11522_c0_g1_i2.p1 TRINITY_DN11522_c0_g1~~TRINITY_DN11522_c0_g1_i2.p1  ORF type:complete len:710 (+),score=112.84 TRINITY_DN11522_c0_g1_i2:115-2130(+)